MKHKIGICCLLMAASLAILTAIAHFSCIFLGPGCYEAQLAPPMIVNSAEQGTWIAPVATVLASLLFIVIALFPLSRAGFLRPLPLLRQGIIVLSIVCLLRGILTIQLKVRHPEAVDLVNLSMGLGWFAAGLFLWCGHRFSDRIDRAEKAS